jgi:hypothetical protein
MRFHELLLEQNNFFHFIGDLMELWNKLKDQNQSTVCHWRGQTRDSPIASAPISRRHRGQSHRVGDRDVRRLDPAIRWPTLSPIPTIHLLSRVL